MGLFLGVMGNLPFLLSSETCQRPHTGFESVELQSAELLWALQGTTVLVLAAGCVGAYVLP